MNNKTKVAAAGVAIALAGMAAIGATSASATQTQPRTVHTASVTAGDTDTVQQGDQTTPDVPGAVDKKEARDTGSAAETKDASESASESAAQSDGPGGHADGPGNVDHQFDGAE